MLEECDEQDFVPAIFKYIKLLSIYSLFIYISIPLYSLVLIYT